MRLKKERWLKTTDAVKLIRDFVPSATPKWFQSGGHIQKQFPEPKRIDGKLYWNERGLQQWLVKRGLTEWSEI